MSWQQALNPPASNSNRARMKPAAPPEPLMNADQINDKSVVVVGRLLKTLRLRDEYYEPLDAPARFVAAVQAGRTGADFLTFVQEINDPTPRCPFHHEYDHLAVLPLSTYEHWANHQISAKAKDRKSTRLNSSHMSISY